MTGPQEISGCGQVLAVCVVHAVIPDVGGQQDETAIDKRAVLGPVEVGSLGLAGDTQADTVNHGGEGQALYAYAQADADWWATELDRELPPGRFGENLRTAGLDLTDALLGERWRVGTTLLEVSSPRIPCMSFQGFWGVPQLVKRFTAHGAPGAYLRVLEPGQIQAEDPVEVVQRPTHDVTIGLAFRGLTHERELLPALSPALEFLPHKDHQRIRELIDVAS